MNNMKNSDIIALQKLLKLRSIFQRVKQISWNFSTTEKRYPPPEAMNSKEIEEMTGWYLAMGIDLKELVNDWNKIYKQNNGSKN